MSGVVDIDKVATAATVAVDLATVTNANAPLLFGEDLDARTSFAVTNQPIGYYSPLDGSPLAIGQYWEDNHRQTAMRYPMAPINVWNWKATIDPFKVPQPLVGNRVAQFGLDEFMEMTERNGMPASEVHMMVNIYRNVNNIDHAGAVQDAADLVAYLNKPWDGVSAFTGNNWEACGPPTVIQSPMASNYSIWETSRGRSRSTIIARRSMRILRSMGRSVMRPTWPTLSRR